MKKFYEAVIGWQWVRRQDYRELKRRKRENEENGDRARHDLTGDRKFSRLGDFMPGVGFPCSPRDTRKTQDTPIPAVLGKTLTDYVRLAKANAMVGMEMIAFKWS